MTRLVRAEWLKLRTTAVPWVLLGVATLLTGLSVVFGFLNPLRTAGTAIGPTWITPTSVAELRNLVGAGVGADVVAVLLGALAISTEFRHKTVTAAFLVTPERGRFIVAKLVTSVLASVALGVTMLVATMAAGSIVIAARHGSVAALWHQVPAVAPGMLLVFALFGVLGVGLGSLLTNQVVVLIVTLGWFLLVEALVGALVDVWVAGFKRWLPGNAAQAAVGYTALGPSHQGLAPSLLPWWGGALTVLAYGLAFAALGWTVMRRRDIT